MYPLNSAAVRLFQNYTIQTATINFAGKEESLTLTEKDIMQGSLSVDRYCSSGSEIEIGSAISSELTFKLDNRDGRYDELNFEGAELYVIIGLRDTAERIPLGYFTVDESPRKRSMIELTALDRMMRFSRLADTSKFQKEASVGDYIRESCSLCGVTLHTDISRLPNINHVIHEFPDKKNVTYRQIIQWCAALTGTCAYIDWNGELRLEWYSDNKTDTVITASERYSSDLYEKDITITGIKAEDDDDNVYLAGTDEYVLSLENNPLIQSGYEEVVTALYGKIGGFTYRPYSCEVKPMPHLYPLDTIVFVDKKGVRHTTIITNATFTMNAHTSLQGVGETKTKSDYYNPSLTEQASRILDQTKKETEKFITEKQQGVLHLNEMIANALGLYLTEYEHEDGSITYYFHNEKTLEESSIIYTFNEGGFAWTHNWNGGNPAWEYGVTSSGNAILNYLIVNNLTADYISVSSIVGAINDTTGEETLRLSAQHIDINGAISANGTFSIDEDGFFTATGGNIAGLIIDRGEISESGEIIIQKSIHTPNDEFHILVNEDEDGNMISSEVLITSLVCDTITARTGTNRFTLCYTDGGIPITAKFAYTMQQTIVTGLWMGTSSITVTSADPRFTGMLSDTKFSITATAFGGSSYTFTITVKRGATSTTGNISYHDGPAFMFFTESGSDTLETITVDPINQYVAIAGDTAPWEDDAYNFGSNSKRWKYGYFKSLDATNLYANGVAVAAPTIKTYDSNTAVIINCDTARSASESGGTAAEARISVVDCGKIKFITVTCEAELENDKWAHVDLRAYCERIRGLSVTSITTSYDTSLSWNNYGAVFVIRYNPKFSTENEIEIGVDEGKSAGGFNLFIIAE